MYIRGIVFSMILLVMSLGYTTAAYQTQGFTNFQEQGTVINFQCDNQCFILIGKKLSDDYVEVSGIQGTGSISLGALGQNGQIIPLNTTKEVEYKKSIYTLTVPSQVPEEAELVIVLNGNIYAQNTSIQLGVLGFFGGIYQGIIEGLQYKEYNPRTINFLEGPMWRGKYINEYFFWKIIAILSIIFLLYITTKNKTDKKKLVKVGIGIITFFWLLFDVFSTINQVKIFQDMTSEKQLMNNGRVGMSSDFYQFLDFIKTQSDVEGKKGYFIAPYPFHFEGKYHIYPFLGVGNLTGSEVIIYYNVMGTLAQSLGFKEPIVQNNQITLENISLNIQKVVEWKPYAKIYFIK